MPVQVHPRAEKPAVSLLFAQSGRWQHNVDLHDLLATEMGPVRAG
jgi:methenyltetrahydromethanopterin cyclohydrolase